MHPPDCSNCCVMFTVSSATVAVQLLLFAAQQSSSSSASLATACMPMHQTASVVPGCTPMLRTPCRAAANCCGCCCSHASSTPALWVGCWPSARLSICTNAAVPELLLLRLAGMALYSRSSLLLQLASTARCAAVGCAGTSCCSSCAT